MGVGEGEGWGGGGDEGGGGGGGEESPAISLDEEFFGENEGKEKEGGGKRWYKPSIGEEMDGEKDCDFVFRIIVPVRCVVDYG